MEAAHTPTSPPAAPAAPAPAPSAGICGDKEEAAEGADEGLCEDTLDAVAAWQHTTEGWQALMLRAWRGEVGAVLACAQELIHGGDFCMQDINLARKLLHTVSLVC